MAQTSLQYFEWEWVEAFRAAVLEVEDVKWIERSDQAVSAICRRIQSLDKTASSAERRALADALYALQALRRDRTRSET